VVSAVTGAALRESGRVGLIQDLGWGRPSIGFRLDDRRACVPLSERFTAGDQTKPRLCAGLARHGLPDEGIDRCRMPPALIESSTPTRSHDGAIAAALSSYVNAEPLPIAGSSADSSSPTPANTSPNDHPLRD